MVRPSALVLLGATAAQALLGSQVRIGRDRGKPMQSELAELVLVTTHPSSILRSREDPERAVAMDEFVADLKSVASWLRGG
jgi:DNA polymerase